MGRIIKVNPGLTGDRRGTYRVVFRCGRVSDDEHACYVNAWSEAEAYRIAMDMPEAESGMYRDVFVQEANYGEKTVRLAIDVRDTEEQALSEKAVRRMYMCVRAASVRQAALFYNASFKGSRFGGEPGEKEDGGRYRYGAIRHADILRAGAPYCADAMSARKHVSEKKKSATKAA